MCLPNFILVAMKLLVLEIKSLATKSTVINFTLAVIFRKLITE